MQPSILAGMQIGVVIEDERLTAVAVLQAMMHRK